MYRVVIQCARRQTNFGKYGHAKIRLEVSANGCQKNLTYGAEYCIVIGWKKRAGNSKKDYSMSGISQIQSNAVIKSTEVYSSRDLTIRRRSFWIDRIG